jgi:predicted ATPase
MDAFTTPNISELECNGKIFYIGFDSIVHKNWKSKDFTILCESSPVIFIDHLKPISLNNRDLISKFRDFVGISF